VRLHAQLFPYHLQDYVCRVLRVTPFRYYCDLLFTVMREEKSYDQIPNFTVRASRSEERACALVSQRSPASVLPARVRPVLLTWIHNGLEQRPTYGGTP
jgi:hypothetical protein